MAGITDSGFRSFMREMGCGVVVTELVSANGLAYQSERTRRLMAFSSDQHPVGIQLFGENLEHLALAARQAEDLGADFVDLNFGCPVPKVVNKGAGSAILRDLRQLRRVLAAVKAAVKIPVTIKVRTGWDQTSRNSEQVAHIAYEEGILWMAIHGRTRAQGYEGLADWDYIRWVKSVSKIPILGNGDIHDASTACRRLRESLCDGVLIGRGCLKNPWIFREALDLRRGADSHVEKNFDVLFDRLQANLLAHFDERVMLIQLKKFSSWFSSGYPGSAQFRKQIFQTQDLSELRQMIARFFLSVQNGQVIDYAAERFLMGGHG
jgi:nifR3 family TIM-barrel protein